MVEILSPNDTIKAIYSKIVEYFENQAQLLWVVHPAAQYVLLYRSPQPDRILRENDILDGEQIVPGFALAVSELFEPLDFWSRNFFGEPIDSPGMRVVYLMSSIKAFKFSYW